MRMAKRGYFTMYIGPMYSGKTTSMTKDVEKYHIANKLCTIVKYIDDTRYDQKSLESGGKGPRAIMTHSGQEFSNVPVCRARLLADVIDELMDYDIVGIDECQFFPDSVEMIDRLTLAGKRVIAACLDGDYMRRPFNRIGELVVCANKVKKLSAVCAMCCEKAIFTARLRGGDEQVEIGTFGTYASVCRQCMHEYLKDRKDH